MEDENRILDPRRIFEIALDCRIFPAGRSRADAIKVEGRYHGVEEFNPDRLKKHDEEVAMMLAQLPDFRDHTTGCSLIFAQYDKCGRHCVEIEQAEELLMLGIALGRVKCITPRRDEYIYFPGRVPRYAIIDK